MYLRYTCLTIKKRWYTCIANKEKGIYLLGNKDIVKPIPAVTSIKQSPVLKGQFFYCPVMEISIWIEPLLRGHLSYKDTFSLSQGWPLNTALTNCLSNKEADIAILQIKRKLVIFLTNKEKDI